MVELFHSAFSNFDEKTSFCMALILSAQGWGLPGQSFAKLSYVFRPINIASQQLAQSVPQISIVAVFKKSRDVLSFENAVYRQQSDSMIFRIKVFPVSETSPRSWCIT